MTFGELEQWTIQLGVGGKLAAATKRRLETELPAFAGDLTPASAPPRVRLPTGESLSNATRMTALRCQCLLLARCAFGASYFKADPRLESLAKDVLFLVMRHAFNSEDPKGIFCCPPCTLSLFPLYASASFRWVDCGELDRNVATCLEEGKSVFSRTYPKAYAKWAAEISARMRR